MKDPIERQDAIDYFVTNVGFRDEDGYLVDDSDELRKIWTDLFNGVPSAQRWIPVSEGLPKEEKMHYWVCTNTEYQCQCRWTNDVYGLGASDRWGWKIFDIPQYQKVVAWMPLPKPWKG